MLGELLIYSPSYDTSCFQLPVCISKLGYAAAIHFFNKGKQILSL